MALTAEQRKTLIDNIVANCACQDAVKQRETLNGAGDSMLTALSGQADELKRLKAPPQAATVANANPSPAAPAKVPTMNEWLATAPPEVQQIVNGAVAFDQQQRVALIEQLTAGVNPAVKASVVNHLQGKNTDELRLLLALVPAAQPAAPPVANYFGAAAPFGQPAAQDDPNDILPLPVMNYGT